MAFRYKAGQFSRLRDEMRRADPRLRFIALAMAGYAASEFGKDLVITEIFRTEADQRRIYGYPPTGKYRQSVHQFGRGLDFGVRVYGPAELDPHPYDQHHGHPGLTRPEVDKLDAWFSGVVSYDDERPEYDSIVHHNVGLGDHLHIQVSWRRTTRLRSDLSQARLIAKRLGIIL